MSIDIHCDIQTDVHAVFQALAEGRRVDPEIAARVDAETTRIKTEIQRQYGELNVAVDLIREIREE